jgi:hypothetical protein
MRANHQLEWRDIDALTVEVATSVGPSRVAVRLELDAGGDITRAYAEARPRPVGKTIVPTPWAGVFGDYQEMRGIRLPTYADARWELPEARSRTGAEGSPASTPLSVSPRRAAG